MFMKQSDLFRGLDRDFVKEIMEITRQLNLADETVLFQEGDPADAVYILLTGRIRLAIGENSLVVYTVSHAGELFGWSTLMGRERFSATATCLEPVKVLSIDRDELAMILDQDPANGMVFYRRVARLLGSRLLESYKAVSSVFRMTESPTQATGQLADDSTMH